MATEWIGLEVVHGSRQGPKAEVQSGTEAPACEWTLYDNLAVQGYDSYYNSWQITAYAGDILAYRGTDTWPPVLTIANGTYTPVGICPTNYYRRNPNTVKQERPYPIRNCILRLPFVASVNEASASLSPGDFVKSNSSGKFIKWDPNSDAQAQKVGQFIGKETSSNFDGWLKWVTSTWGDYPLVPMFLEVPTTQVSNDGNANAAQAISTTLNTTPASSLKASLVTADKGNRIFYTTYANISGLHVMDVYSGGTAATKLQSDGIYGNEYQGSTYQVDLSAGTITFDSTVQTTVTVQANYWYEKGYSRGIQYGAGQQGLTDGTISGLGGGTPAIADASGSTGILYVEAFGFGLR